MIIEDSYLIRFIDSIRLNIDDKDEFLRTKLNKDTEVEVYQKAIWLGYRDVCRTIRNENDKLEVGDCDLAESMKDYIDGKSGFDHDHYCDLLVRKYSLDFGQAQKIVNMAFKYLYCLTKDSDMEIKERFDACHMPIDNVMLDWIYENIKIDFTGNRVMKSKMGPWSHMQKGSSDKYIDDNNNYTYYYYQKLLNRYCIENKVYQLQLDFENWFVEAQKAATKHFLNSFSKDEINNGVHLKRIDEYLNQSTTDQDVFSQVTN